MQLSMCRHLVLLEITDVSRPLRYDTGLSGVAQDLQRPVTS